MGHVIALSLYPHQARISDVRKRVVQNAYLWAWRRAGAGAQRGGSGAACSYAARAVGQRRMAHIVGHTKRVPSGKAVQVELSAISETAKSCGTTQCAVPSARQTRKTQAQGCCVGYVVEMTTGVRGCAGVCVLAAGGQAGHVWPGALSEGRAHRDSQRCLGAAMCRRRAASLVAERGRARPRRERQRGKLASGSQQPVSSQSAAGTAAAVAAGGRRRSYASIHDDDSVRTLAWVGGPWTMDRLAVHCAAVRLVPASSPASADLCAGHRTGLPAAGGRAHDLAGTGNCVWLAVCACARRTSVPSSGRFSALGVEQAWPKGQRAGQGPKGPNPNGRRG